MTAADDATALLPTPPPIPGLRFVRRLGGGGMGTIWLAEEELLGRMVAVKTISERETDPAARARFLREAQSQAALEHPHVVRIYSFGDKDGVAYIVMELVQGETLAERIRREGAMPVDEVRRIALQIVDALDAAAVRGVIHRDVKPSNILLDEAGNVRVADFGLARKVASDDSLTGSGFVVGTPNYIAPEQAAGLPVDHRADIYSLGIVLYEMLTGERPPAGTLEGELAPLVRQMLRKEPEARPQSYGELFEALTPGDAPAPRRRWLWPVIAAAIVFAVALGFFLTRERPPRYTGAPITIRLARADVRDFLRAAGTVGKVNIAVDPEVKSAVDVDMKAVPWDQAVDVVLRQHGLISERHGNLIRVSTLDARVQEQDESRRLAEAMRAAGQSAPSPSDSFSGEPVSINLKDADIRDVCRVLQEMTGANIAVDPEVQANVTVDVKDVPWDQVFDLVLRQHDLTYVAEGNVIRVTTRAKLMEELEKLAKLRRAAD